MRGGSVAENSERAAELAAEESVRRDAGLADDAPAQEVAPPNAADGAVAAPAAESAPAEDEAADDDEPTADDEPADPSTDDGEHDDDLADEDDENYREERVVVIRRGVFYAVAAVAILVIAVLAGLNVYQSVKGEPAVATVNGTKITRSAYDKQIARLTDPSSGAAIASSTLDQMINTQLLEQDAAKQKITASPDEIDAELAKQKAGFSSDSDYKNALQGAHLTETQFREQLKDQVLIQKLVLNKVTVSDDAVQQEYNQNKDTTYQGKTLDDVKDQIKTNLLQQQQQTAEQTYFDNLQSKAKITRHIPGA
jgi:foldase protein PrsA